MPHLETDRPRRAQPYVPRSARTVAHRIMTVIDDPMSTAPTGPLPFMTPRVANAFDRIMAACMPTALAEDADVRSSSMLPPPRKPRRR